MQININHMASRLFWSAVFIACSKWLDGCRNIWLAEWMNESVIHSECGYIFLLWQKTNFWSYSWNVGGCNSKLSLINPIQPSRDHLLLVQCRIPRLSVHLSPQPSSIHLPMHRWSTPGSRHCLDRSPSASIQWQPLFSSLHFLDISCSTVFCCSHSRLALPFNTAQLVSFSISFSCLAPGVPWGSFFTLCSFSAPAMLSPSHDHNLWG